LPSGGLASFTDSNSSGGLGLAERHAGCSAGDMTRLEKHFDVPIPLQDLEAQWQRAQRRSRAEVRFSPIDEQHTRVHVSGDAQADVDQVVGDLRRAGLAGPEAAGNPGARGVAPGGAGGTFAGGTGGTPGPGGGKPGTT